MPLSQAVLTEAGGMRGLEAMSNRVREDYVGNEAIVTYTFTTAAVGTRTPKGSATTAWSSTVAAAGSAPSTGGGALYTDNFDRADAALTTPWVNMESTHSIVSNKVVVGPASPTVSYYNQTITADQWAETDVYDQLKTGYTTTGVCVRITGNDFYYAWVTGSNASIYKRVGGTYTLVGTGSSTLVASYKVRLEVQGTTLRLYLNGVLEITATDTALATGKPGIISANPAGSPSLDASLDNFRCGDLPYTP